MTETTAQLVCSHHRHSQDVDGCMQRSRPAGFDDLAPPMKRLSGENRGGRSQLASWDSGS